MSILFKQIDAAAGRARTRVRARGALLTLLAALVIAGVGAGVVYATRVTVDSFCQRGTEGGKCAEEATLSKEASPRGVAVNETGAGGVEAGDVYLADSENNRIEELGPSGSFVRAWGYGVVALGAQNRAAAESAVTVNATGGSFTLTFSGQKTSALPFDAADGEVQAALDALSTIGDGGVTVTGGPGNEGGHDPYFLLFGGALAETTTKPTSTATGLTGGAKTATVTEVEKGGSGFDVCDTKAEKPDPASQCGEGAKETKAGALGLPSGIAVSQTTGDVYVAEGTTATIDEYSAKGAFLRRWGWNTITSGPDKAGEQQALTVNATSGKFTLTFNGQTTSELEWDATPAEVEEALEALSSIKGADGSATVSGGPGGEGGLAPYLISFGGALVGEAQSSKGITATDVSLAGGAATATVAQTIPGATGFDVCEQGRDICREASGGTGAGQIGSGSRGRAIAVDPSTGNVYLADIGNQRVEEYSAEGQFVEAFGWDVVSAGPDAANRTSFTASTTSGSKTLGEASGFSGSVAAGSVIVGPGIPLGATVASVSESAKTLELSVAATATATAAGLTASSGFEVCKAGVDVCRAGSAGAGAGQFGSEGPSRVAVAADGDVYAVDSANDRVERFEPSGGGYAPSQFGPVGLETPPFAVAVEAGSEDVLIGRRSGDGTSEMQVAAYSPAGTPLETGQAGAASEGTSVNAINDGWVTSDASEGSVYLTSSSTVATAPGVFVLNNPPQPVVTIDDPADVTATSAMASGTVNPEGFTARYDFEFSTNGVNWTEAPSGGAELPAGTEPVVVRQTLAGLEPSATYRVRLHAENNGTPSIEATSEEKTLQTEGTAPLVYGELASPVGETTATVTAYVNPENSATSYHIEYGAGEGYASSTVERHLGSGAAGVQIGEALAGLATATGYHYRVVATNARGETTDGTSATFTTQNPSGSCSNEAARAEDGSADLPACRALELVSPPYKEGSGLETGNTLAAVEEPDVWVDADGEQVVNLNKAAYAGASSARSSLEPSAYDYAREPADGWRTFALEPVAAQYPAMEVESASPEASTTPSQTLWFGKAASQSVNAESLYLRGAEGAFTEVGPALPPAKVSGEPSPTDPGISKLVSFAGADRDFSRVLFAIERAGKEEHGEESPSFLWPRDETLSGSTGEQRVSLYEYAGAGNSTPTLVGVNNEGAQISTEGDELGGPGEAAKADLNRLNDYNAVSAQGSTVFFTAHGALFARVGAQPASATTVNVAGSSECEGSDLCNVTKEVTFQGASEDGSQVFFTSEQPLVAGDGDATENLYVCEGLPGDAGGALAAEAGAVNRCPDLKEVSTPEAAGTAAKVLGVAAISEDASHVYYVAEGVLTSAPNAQGQTAQAGHPNLYVHEPNPAGPGQYKTVFVATLAGSDADEDAGYGLSEATIGASGIWSRVGLRPAQTTPDGEHLVFTSSADLTGGDTSTALQVFEYDASSGELTRLSFGQDGDGNTSTDPATIPLQRFSRSNRQITAQEGAWTASDLGAISENGEYVVFQSDAALSEGAIAGDANIYQYHDGNVSLVYDGKPGPGAASKPALEGIDGSGEDIFFTTSASLVAQDTDTAVDLYDARIDGGFGAPTAESKCEGEECQGPLTSPLTAITPGSTGLPTIGNLVTPPEKAIEPEKAQTKPAGKVEITGHKTASTTITLTVKAPAKGKLTASGAGLKKTTKSVKGAASYKLNLELTTAEQKKLKAKKKLTLTVAVAFKPASGKSSSASVKVKLKG